MLPCPLPLWLRHKIVELIAAYRATIQLCDERCEQLLAEGRNADDFGTVSEYNMDAKYCAGMATRTPLLILESLTPDELNALARVLKAELPSEPLKPEAYEREKRRWEYGPEAWREIPTDPQTLAPKAWERRRQLNPKPPEPIPEPEHAIPDFRVSELLQPLTQREAEALILTKVCLMTEGQAAEIMGKQPEYIRKLVRRAINRLSEQQEPG